MTGAADPLILTLELAEPAQSLFQELRDRHFPPERNIVPAHVSMFHALPGSEQAAVLERLSAVTQAPLPVTITGVFSLGRGVAFRLHAPELDRIRAALAADWHDWLSAQDRAGYRAHITVQNKVDPAEARLLLEDLQRAFTPIATEGIALRLWRYRGGPWEALHRHALRVS